MLMMEVLLLVVGVYILFYLISNKEEGDMETLGAYECGFVMGEGVRAPFSYRFFLIGILFLIFDVEIALMLPLPYMWGVTGSLVFMLFIWVLILGLSYEYYYGSLIWV